jgi:chaperonin GroEL
MINIGFHPLEVKKGIDLAAQKFLHYLDSIKTSLQNEKELFSLAMITTNKDKQISEIVTKALIESGNKCIIQIEESNIGNTELKVIHLLIRGRRGHVSSLWLSKSRIPYKFQ